LCDPSITLTAEELNWSDTVLSEAAMSAGWPLIGLHCSAAHTHKQWPPARFGQVVAHLKRSYPDLGVVSFGTLEERANSELARKEAGDVRWLEATGAWGIRQSLAVLERCDLLVSGDTGVMHMAAAVGTRTLSVFGPTSPGRVAPTYNGGVTVVPQVPCHPCYKDRYEECSCIHTIDVERVAQLALRCLRMKKN